jgi:hypothetical protein
MKAAIKANKPPVKVKKAVTPAAIIIACVRRLLISISDNFHVFTEVGECHIETIISFIVFLPKILARSPSALAGIFLLNI